MTPKTRLESPAGRKQNGSSEKQISFEANSPISTVTQRNALPCRSAVLAGIRANVYHGVNKKPDMKPLLLFLFAALALPLLAADSLEDAEKAWATAITKRDFTLLDKVLSPDLVYFHSTGVVDSKDSYIATQKKGDRRYDSVAHLNMKAKQYGDTGVVTAKMRMQGKNSSGAFDDTLLLTHVWVRQGGSWRLVAHQTTKIP